MKLPTRLMFLAAVSVLTACVLTISGTGASWAGPQDPVASGTPDYLSWPHEGSDLKPDPRVRLGVLPNGMRYAIMKNKQPAGTASVFLRISAGSMQEADDEQGFAHLLEHMAFLGSQNVSKGEMVKSLQRLGLSFGGDTNAQTGTEHTLYTLNPSAATPDAIERSLFLLREIADHLTLSQDTVDTERGVVLAEERSRDTPGTRAWLAWQSTAYDGLRMTHRDPIGKKRLIARATAAQLRSFYERFYRPERGFLIIVGDIDPDQMEGRVKALFSDWTQPGPVGADPDRGTLVKHPLRAAWFAEPTLNELAGIYWLSPDERSPRDVVRYRRDVMRQIAIQILNRRLSRLALSSDAPFVNAWAGAGSQRHVATLASLRMVPKPGRWNEAMQAVVREFRRMLQHGVQPEELASQLRELRSSQDDSVRNADTLDNLVHAYVLSGMFESRSVYMAPGETASLIEGFIPEMTVEKVNGAFRDAFKGETSLIFLQGPKAIPGGKQAILKVWNLLSNVDVPPPAPYVQRDFPYTDFGVRGTVVSTERLDNPGVTKIVFNNGVRLNVMMTTYEHERIGIDVSLPGGYLDFSSREQMLDSLYTGTWLRGGLGKIDQQGIVEATLGQQVSWYAGMTSDSYVLSGGTTKKDLLTQMRILAAHVVDPAFRREALQQEQASNEMADRSRRATAPAALGNVLQSKLHSDDGRWTTPSAADVNRVTTDDIRSRLMPALRRRPIEITMVGDIEVDAAIDAVAQTFGALSRRDEVYVEPAGARDVRFPMQGKTVMLTHDGRRDQAVLYLAWPGPDRYTDVPAGRAFELLGQIIDNELTELLRGQGKTYSPSSYAVSSSTFAGWGYLGVSVETSPQDLDGIKASVQQVIARLKAGDISQDMIERARRPFIEGLAKWRKSNWYWRGVLNSLQRDPKELSREQSVDADYSRATGDTLASLARQYLQEDRLVEFRVLPAEKGH